jgi:SOS response regulatory protein OraA/RecX
VIYQLRSKQVPPKFITEALGEIPDDEYRNILLDVANTKWQTYDPNETKAKRRSKLVTFLASRGYESPEIQTMLAEHFADEPATAPQE